MDVGQISIERNLVDPDPPEAAPSAPETVEETGLDPQFLLGLVLKTLYVTGAETTPEMSEHLALPEFVIETVLETAKQKRLAEVLGLSDSKRSLYRYALSDRGRTWAVDELQKCHYVGPAPVTLDSYRAVAATQGIDRDPITPESIADALSHLVLPDGVVEMLGPAANSGKSILLYGAPGNGKTSIAESLGRAFQDSIRIPHCIEVGGQVIRIFDEAVHVRCEAPGAEARSAGDREVDRRWVECRRPVILTSGELTMEMLDLSFDPVSKFYEAPAHLKANGGIFIIDDFGRQQVRSSDLVNRWILPLERRKDFLTLHTGKKLEVPFDQLVVFSTNYPPGELLDAAALRRIPYKFAIEPPSRVSYSAILRDVCAAHRLSLDPEVLPYLVDVFYPETQVPVSGAHPRFLVDHVLERCRFHGLEARMSLQWVHDAVQHLMVNGSPPPVPRGEDEIPDRFNA